MPVELDPDPFGIMNGVARRLGQPAELLVRPAADRRDIAIDSPESHVAAILWRADDSECGSTLQRRLVSDW